MEFGGVIKHGIDFVEVQALWLDDGLIEGPGTVIGYEVRALIVGMIAGKLWTVCVTYRGSVVRIILARGAREEERRAYEE